MPSEWQLFQNHPNPFNAVTNISVRVPLGVSMGRSPYIHIHDIRGRIVRTFTLDSAAMSGTVKVTWNGKDESGMVLPAGLYIYRLNLGSVVLSRKMLYIK